MVMLGVELGFKRKKKYYKQKSRWHYEISISVLKQTRCTKKKHYR